MFTEGLLRDRRILVTGGGTGLGLAIATRYAELGASLVLLGRRADPLVAATAELQRNFGADVDWFQCDICKPEEVSTTLERIWSKAALNGLVNNAAGNFVAKTEDLSYRAFDAVFNIVLHGTTYVTLECGKRWLRQRAKATVISIVTTYASTGSAFVVPSAMAKAGVLAMTRSLAVEWGRRGVRLNAIAPGLFPTAGAWERLVPNERMHAAVEKRNPLGRFGQHAELANLAAYLMSDLAGYINGEVVTIDGGEWLQGAGQFNLLESMSDEEWQQMAARGAKRKRP